jgi:hypothetical protein
MDRIAASLKMRAPPCASKTLQQLLDYANDCGMDAQAEHDAQTAAVPQWPTRSTWPSPNRPWTRRRPPSPIRPPSSQAQNHEFDGAHQRGDVLRNLG